MSLRFARSPVMALPRSTGHLVALEDGGMLVRTPAGTLLRVQDPPAGLLEALDGPAASGLERAFVERLEEEAARRHAAERTARWPEPQRAVILTGVGAIPTAVPQALSAWGVTVGQCDSAAGLAAGQMSGLSGAEARARGKAASGESAGADRAKDQCPVLVISYAEAAVEWEHWDAFEAHRPRHVSWLRAYREGEVCFVDPLALAEDEALGLAGVDGVDGADAAAAADAAAEGAEDPGAGYATGPTQVRRRRIAAHYAPEATACWIRHAPPAPEPPDPFAHALTVGRILGAAQAWGQRGPAVGDLRRTLWKLVPATGAVSEHTLLGYDSPFSPIPSVRAGETV